MVSTKYPCTTKRRLPCKAQVDKVTSLSFTDGLIPVGYSPKD